MYESSKLEHILDTQKQFFVFYSWDSIFSLSYKKNDSTPLLKSLSYHLKSFQIAKTNSSTFKKKYAHMCTLYIANNEQKQFSNLGYSLRQPHL